MAQNRVIIGLLACLVLSAFTIGFAHAASLPKNGSVQIVGINDVIGKLTTYIEPEEQAWTYENITRNGSEDNSGHGNNVDKHNDHSHVSNELSQPQKRPQANGQDDNSAHTVNTPHKGNSQTATIALNNGPTISQSFEKTTNNGDASDSKNSGAHNNGQGFAHAASLPKNGSVQIVGINDVIGKLTTYIEPEEQAWTYENITRNGSEDNSGHGNNVDKHNDHSHVSNELSQPQKRPQANGQDDNSAHTVNTPHKGNSQTATIALNNGPTISQSFEKTTNNGEASDSENSGAHNNGQGFAHAASLPKNGSVQIVGINDVIGKLTTYIEPEEQAWTYENITRNGSEDNSGHGNNVDKHNDHSHVSNELNQPQKRPQANGQDDNSAHTVNTPHKGNSQTATIALNNGPTISQSFEKTTNNGDASDSENSGAHNNGQGFAHATSLPKNGSVQIVGINDVIGKLTTYIEPEEQAWTYENITRNGSEDNSGHGNNVDKHNDHSHVSNELNQPQKRPQANGQDDNSAHTVNTPHKGNSQTATIALNNGPTISQSFEKTTNNGDASDSKNSGAHNNGQGFAHAASLPKNGSVQIVGINDVIGKLTTYIEPEEQAWTYENITRNGSEDNSGHGNNVDKHNDHSHVSNELNQPQKRPQANGQDDNSAHTVNTPHKGNSQTATIALNNGPTISQSFEKTTNNGDASDSKNSGAHNNGQGFAHAASLPKNGSVQIVGINDVIGKLTTYIEPEEQAWTYENITRNGSEDNSGHGNNVDKHNDHSHVSNELNQPQKRPQANGQDDNSAHTVNTPHKGNSQTATIALNNGPTISQSFKKTTNNSDASDSENSGVHGNGQVTSSANSKTDFNGQTASFANSGTHGYAVATSSVNSQADGSVQITSFANSQGDGHARATSSANSKNDLNGEAKYLTNAEAHGDAQARATAGSKPDSNLYATAHAVAGTHGNATSQASAVSDKHTSVQAEISVSSEPYDSADDTPTVNAGTDHGTVANNPSIGFESDGGVSDGNVNNGNGRIGIDVRLKDDDESATSENA